MSRFCKVNLKNQTKKDNSSQLSLSLLPCDDDDDVMKLFVCLCVFHRFFYANPIQSVGRSAFQNLPELRTL